MDAGATLHNTVRLLVVTLIVVALLMAAGYAFGVRVHVEAGPDGALVVFNLIQGGIADKALEIIRPTVAAASEAYFAWNIDVLYVRLGTIFALEARDVALILKIEVILLVVAAVLDVGRAIVGKNRRELFGEDIFLTGALGGCLVYSGLIFVLLFGVSGGDPPNRQLAIFLSASGVAIFILSGIFVALEIVIRWTSSSLTGSTSQVINGNFRGTPVRKEPSFLSSTVPTLVSGGSKVTSQPETSKESAFSSAGSNAGPSPATAYVLNIVIPGVGNLYFGQPVIGVLFVLSMLFTAFIFFFGASAALLGIIIIVVSVIGAFFTLGLSLVGVPVGILFLLMGAGPVFAVVIWLFCLIASELLVRSKAAKTSTASLG